MNTAVIVAGGSGERLGRTGGKQLLELRGLPVLSHTVTAFEACEDIDAIIVVAHPGRVDEYRRVAIDPVVPTKVRAVVAGGATRQESVLAGLMAVPADTDIVVVHDGARPLVKSDIVSAALRVLQEDPDLSGVVVGHPAYDTLKLVRQDATVSDTLDRDGIWVAQTPQVFHYAVLRAAHEVALRDGRTATDDAMLVEHAGGRVRMLEGPRNNIKVTVAEDVTLAEALLSLATRGDEMRAIRIGLGYDAHAFSPGRRLILGGVAVPYSRGLAGHSDADVLTHALMDAIVSAMREGDIGGLFPDSDPAYKDIASLELLCRTAQLMRDRGFELVDADTVVVMEEPKLAPYRDAMRARLAEALAVDISRIGVKATTTEGLGYEGRKEGVTAEAVVILEQITT